MKWVLIIIVLSAGWGNKVIQHETGPYLTEQACLRAAAKVPHELPVNRSWLQNKRATITTLCLPVDGL